MTYREIKIELAKAALASGMSLEVTKGFYQWITEVPEHEVPEENPTQWDDTPIEELASKTKIKSTITSRCWANGINTVGDLIRCGGRKFLTFQNVGKGTVTRIDDALETYFGIEGWYKL